MIIIKKQLWILLIIKCYSLTQEDNVSPLKINTIEQKKRSYLENNSHNNNKYINILISLFCLILLIIVYYIFFYKKDYSRDKHPLDIYKNPNINPIEFIDPKILKNPIESIDHNILKIFDIKGLEPIIIRSESLSTDINNLEKIYLYFESINSLLEIDGKKIQLINIKGNKPPFIMQRSNYKLLNNEFYERKKILQIFLHQIQSQIISLENNPYITIVNQHNDKTLFYVNFFPCLSCIMDGSKLFLVNPTKDLYDDNSMNNSMNKTISTHDTDLSFLENTSFEQKNKYLEFSSSNFTETMKNVIDIKNLIEQIQPAINDNNFSVLSQKYPVKIYKNMTFDKDNTIPRITLLNDE